MTNYKFNQPAEIHIPIFTSKVKEERKRLLEHVRKRRAEIFRRMQKKQQQLREE